MKKVSGEKKSGRTRGCAVKGWKRRVVDAPCWYTIGEKNTPEEARSLNNLVEIRKPCVGVRKFHPFTSGNANTGIR